MKNTLTLSDAELQQAVDHLSGLDKSVMAFDAPDFCKYWPIVKKVLEFLKSYPAASWVVAIVIQLGDAYAKKHCG